MGDLLVVAVVAGPLAEPRREDGPDREVELVVRVAREVAPGVGLDDRLVRVGDLAQGGRVEVGVLLRTVSGLRRVEGVVEPLAVDAHHDPAEHLDEPPVGVPAEPLVAGQRDEPGQRRLVEPEVEDGVHHPGHRELRPGADAHEERVRRVAEALAGLALDRADRLEHVVPEAVGEPLAGREVVVAGLGRDREPGRHGQPRDRHLGQAGALPAEQVAHRGVALRATGAPGVDVALRRAMGARGRAGGRVGHVTGSCGGRAVAPIGAGIVLLTGRLYRRPPRR